MDTLLTSTAETPEPPEPPEQLMVSETPAILYVLHSGQLFGTERMALTTLLGVRDLVTGIGAQAPQAPQELKSAIGDKQATWPHLLLSPPGPLHSFAKQEQICMGNFANLWQLCRHMLAFIWLHRQVCVISTSISHALLGLLLSMLPGINCRHLHIVHGGTDERLSYGRKKYLRWFAVEMVAVSYFVRERLIAHAVPAHKTHVIENFLTPNFAQDCPQHPQFSQTVKKVICVSRLDPIKQVGLLLDALLTPPAYPIAPILHQLHFVVFGRGWQEVSLRQRAEQAVLPIQFVGFSDAIAIEMAGADLLVHTCAEEPFGLVILEAMAARIPVLVPDRGGPSSFISDGVNGFTYRANDAAHLAQRLMEIQKLPASNIQSIVNTASQSLAQRFAAAARCAEYLALIQLPPAGRQATQSNFNRRAP